MKIDDVEIKLLSGESALANVAKCSVCRNGDTKRSRGEAIILSAEFA